MFERVLEGKRLLLRVDACYGATVPAKVQPVDRVGFLGGFWVLFTTDRRRWAAL